jgi:hypothetical protein
VFDFDRNDEHLPSVKLDCRDILSLDVDRSRSDQERLIDDVVYQMNVPSIFARMTAWPSTSVTSLNTYCSLNDTNAESRFTGSLSLSTGG